MYPSYSDPVVVIRVELKSDRIRFWWTSTDWGGQPTLEWETRLTGDAAILLESHLRGETPLGILCDRLEEHPDEMCTTQKNLVLAVAQYMRTNMSGLVV